jgi:prepilin peptidase CpaA
MNFAGLDFTGLSLKAHLFLAFPLLLALWMAWSDVKSRRIPNYLTFGCALAGLGYQLACHGLTGLADGSLGMGLGFILLIPFYIKGGLGAGDVKALAGLATWLGPLQTLYLFIYMGISGVFLVVFVLFWRGLLWSKIRQIWESLINLVLLCFLMRSYPVRHRTPTSAADIPYAVTLAMGMAIVCWRGLRIKTFWAS